MFHRLFIVFIFSSMPFASNVEVADAVAVNSPAIPKSAAALTLSLAPAAVVGGNSTTATITLSTVAPANGVEITLRSGNTDVARFGGVLNTLDTQIRIPKGGLSTTVPVRTFGVAARTVVTLQAISPGEVAGATLTVNPASVHSLSIAPSSVVGGQVAKGTVTLDGLAPPNSVIAVQVSVVREAASRTGDTSATASSPISVPSPVTISGGSASATFSINTEPVPSDTTVHLTARVAGGSVREASSRSDGTSNTIVVNESVPTAALTISAPVVNRLQLIPATVAGGNGLIGTVVLTGQAPARGLTVSVSASSNEATVPSSVIVPSGVDRTQFKITTQTTSSPQSVTISAVIARNNPNQLGSTNNLKQIGISTHDGASNTISFGDSPAVTATLSITPTPPPFTISVQPSPVTGGTAVTISLTTQPSNTSSTSSSISLTSNHPELLLLPSSVPLGTGTTLSSGPQTTTLQANTNPASADQNVTITATGFSTSVTTTLLIKQTPPAITSFTLRPTTVKGGLNVIAELTVSSTATNSVVVNLTTNHPELITLPAAVTVSPSAVPTPLTLRTSPAMVQTAVTITASNGAQTLSQTINVVP